jgi:hypothetical protein
MASTPIEQHPAAIADSIICPEILVSLPINMADRLETPK